LWLLEVEFEVAAVGQLVVVGGDYPLGDGALSENEFGSDNGLSGGYVTRNQTLLTALVNGSVTYGGFDVGGGGAWGEVGGDHCPWTCLAFYAQPAGLGGGPLGGGCVGCIEGVGYAVRAVSLLGLG
jgi:hypothetical protein